ncbi:MAG TPA: plasmid recombination protein [Alphaproteobacteria bacterium]|nr:plasmid recombination protein [Alphaproteobacteria bacterium]
MAMAERAVDPKGRRLRRDAQILAAGVASFPARLAELDGNDRDAWAAWERDTLTWLRSQYGDRLKSVVRHRDEPYPHLHFLAVPDLDAGKRVDDLHPGRAAIAAAKREGVTQKRVLDQRYRAAMRMWQDSYWCEVGAKHQLDRYGPRRRRLSRPAFRVERRLAELTASIVADRNHVREENRNLSHECNRLITALTKVANQAHALLGCLLDPLHADCPAERPTWLGVVQWAAIKRRLQLITVLCQAQRNRPKMSEKSRRRLPIILLDTRNPNL